MKGWRPETTVGWLAFRAWAICGALWVFPWFTFGIGIVTLPFAGWLTWALGRHAPAIRDAWGLLFGIGVVFALAGLGNRNTMSWARTGGLLVGAASIGAYVLTPNMSATQNPVKNDH
ncbi:MAG: hypothetical protein WBM90_03430 [Acidimicrobiia bacterium]